MAADVVRLLGCDIPAQIGGSVDIFQRATLRCGQYDEVWCEYPTNPIRSFAAARAVGMGGLRIYLREHANAGFLA
jgi:hypothetical protein